MHPILVIGAGPHGVAISASLAGALGPGSVCLLDAEDAPLAGWSRRSRAIGMRRMRSPWVHHCATDPGALYRWAAQHGTATDRTPPVEAFERHALAVAEGAELEVRRGWACGLVRDDDGWEVRLHDAPPLRARRVILAGGLDAHRRRGLGGLPLPDGPAEARDGRVAVIGAGHTGASAALHILDDGGRVDLFAARGLREQRTDVEPGWFGPRNLRGFSASAPERRRERLRTARFGSTTPELSQRLRALRPCGRLRVRDGRVTGISGVPGERTVCTTDDEAHGPYDAVYEATGYAVSLRNEPLLAGLDLPAVDGMPILDDALQALPGLHLAGPLAELVLGPAGRNLWGAQRAAERITAAVRRDPELVAR
jgi:cation diffusion facilitator CzcD-associated flavoprotein CzcO